MRAQQCIKGIKTPLMPNASTKLKTNMTMKKVILLLTLLICINLSAQEATRTQTLFVRVFDLDGKKIGKGHIYATNDSLLVLKKNEKLKEIYVREIGKIKTKRSGGHNFLIGATSGVVAGAILGSINSRQILQGEHLHGQEDPQEKNLPVVLQLG